MLSNADDDGSSDVSVKDVLTYQFVAQNTGNVILTNVMVSDPLDGLSVLGCDPVLGSDLAPNATMTCTADYTVTQENVDAGEILNRAEARAEGPGGDPTDPTDDITGSDSEAVAVPQKPGITITKGSAYLGDLGLGVDVFFDLVVENTGNVTLSNGMVTDDLDGLRNFACIPVLGSELAPEATMRCSADYTVTQDDVDRGRIFNTGKVRVEGPGGDQTDPADDVTDTGSHWLTLTQNPSISLSKTAANVDEDGSESVTLRDTLVYTLTAVNDGNVMLTDVTLKDTMLDLSSPSCDRAYPATLGPGETLT